MLNGLFELISGLLNFFYELVPDYAVAIALLTCTVMLVTTPLTLKSTRSMIEMQRLQPEIRKLQVQYKDDRQKLNEEMMRFYKEHEINPLGGCLPMLVQLPVFSILFYVVRGLIHQTPFVGIQQALFDQGLTDQVVNGFQPKYLHSDSALYESLLGKNEMVSAGVDLALSPATALGEGFLTALPYVVVLAMIAGLAWYQQKQIMGRNSHSEVTQQQKMMMRLGPVLQVGFTFISPAALGIYFLISTAWRVVQQTYITHSLYKGEDSVGVQAQKAMAAMRAEKKAATNGGARTGGKAPAKKTPGTKGALADKPAAKSTKTTKKRTTASGNGTSSDGGPGRPSERAAAGSAASGATGPAKAAAHPRSRKKKKRK
jgi:YidC/Oxa1 family membrane protein insertase